MKASESVDQVLDLRLRAIVPPLPQIDSVDHVKILRKQDCSYYSQKECSSSKESRDIGREQIYFHENDTITNAVDGSCRELMAEWEYKIVDHLGLARELVGIAFSFLDRFTAKCECDRKAYKLAAMTSLFLAIKLHNPRQFTICALVTLSRGEFKTSDIAQMESIMLRTLDWRLNPPTVQSFVNAWGNCVLQGKNNLAIERAHFLAEISVFDTLLASKERALIAIAALVDGMEGLNRCTSKREGNSFLQTLKDEFRVDYSEEEVQATRARLWYIYSKTSQCLVDFHYRLDSLVPHKKGNGIIERKSSLMICRKKGMKTSRSVRAAKLDQECWSN